MAHSLEVRVPLLDHPFVEWAAQVPPALKLNGSEGKYLYKKALERYLPHDVLYRSKMGFAVPLGAWFRGPLRDTVRTALAGPILGETGMFDMDYVATLVREHQSRVREHSSVLWSLLMFESFLRQVHTRDVETPALAAARAVGTVHGA
jgi:asparagine synthase (glutamine-hydrolysing)